ncbi:PREDICTED: leucine-rich repeat-containing protein 74B [Nanorana parkeri]|uniref:leucine-rich repeat-containing protein 74B n=1 Tax=Nanorana parkeri TaxID=125878 RepID=UPI000854933A|nr:PREDICTED: leucine-rich repeat-containing protein 74B [Nanorana parkeri]
MVLSKRFSKDISSMLPSVEEAKDAEEQEGTQSSVEGISSRPPSRPLPSLSRGSVDNKIVQRSATARSVKEEGSDDEDTEVSESKEKTVHSHSEDFTKSKENDEDCDTDLEIEDAKLAYDPSGKSRYLSACQLFGVVPVSYYLRHMGDSKLVMRHHGLGAQAAKAIALSLVTNTSIVSLNLSDNWVEGDGAAAITDMLKENCYISELHLCDNRLGLKGAKALSGMLMENMTLQKVYLSGNEFDDRATPCLSDALMNNQRLECIDLSHNMFGDGSGKILGAAIAENTGMLEMNLSWNHFRGKGAVAIAKGLGANIFLRVLDLSYNGFGNDGATALAEALKANNVLEELNISNNRISLQGAVRFALCLKENKTLKVLKMARNPMQSEGCFAILKSIQANSESAVESLDFSDIVVNKQFDDLYTVVKTSMPNLTIKLGGNSNMFKKTFPKVDQIQKVKQYAMENNLNLSELFSKTDEQIQMTHEDFKQKLATSGIIMPNEEIQQLIGFLDKDKTGTVDFSAFQKALSS